MPRVKVVADDGAVVLDELVLPEQLGSEHVRRQLGERIAWAVDDATARAAAPPAAARGPLLRAA